MQIAFVGLPDAPSYNYVRDLQVKMYELFGTKEVLKLEPHFTLKYKFDIDDLAAAEQYFDELASQTKPFEATASGIGTFKSNVVFLDIAKNRTLTSLHGKILSDVNKRFSALSSELEGEKLHFHITLAYKDINDETFQKIKKYFGGRDIKLQFSVQQIGMYLLPKPEDQWFLYRIGKLNG
jgi:2'-5' RNA ligase